MIDFNKVLREMQPKLKKEWDRVMSEDSGFGRLVGDKQAEAMTKEEFEKRFE